MAGFTWRLNANGADIPTVMEWISADSSFVVGDFTNEESGQADLAVTTDVDLIGAVVGSASVLTALTALTATSSKILVVSNIDAVYGVADANARNGGVTLDISGASGAQTVASSSNTEFRVYSTKNNAADETLVMIDDAVHYMS